MKAATLFLGFTGLVLVGTLTLLWQAFGPHTASSEKPEPLARSRPVSSLRPAESEANGVRSVYPRIGADAAHTPPQNEAPSERAPAAAAPPQVDAPRSAASETRPSGRIEIDPNPGVPGGAIDLNTATLEQLNVLGAGLIGKTIIANRPYAAPDDLLGRRVLNRRDYDAIKPHVVVR